MYNKYLMELEDQYPELFEKYRKKYIKEGFIEGFKEGFRQGYMEGFKEGRRKVHAEDGIEKERKKVRSEYAEELLSAEEYDALIEECKKLCEEELLSLKESL